MLGGSWIILAVLSNCQLVLWTCGGGDDGGPGNVGLDDASGERVGVQMLGAPAAW